MLSRAQGHSEWKERLGSSPGSLALWSLLLRPANFKAPLALRSSTWCAKGESAPKVSVQAWWPEGMRWFSPVRPLHSVQSCSLRAPLLVHTFCYSVCSFATFPKCSERAECVFCFPLSSSGPVTTSVLIFYIFVFVEMYLTYISDYNIMI